MKLRGLHLHVDAASGAAGDMTLGALLDLGVPVDVVGAALDAIGAGRQRLRIAKVTKHGIAATERSGASALTRTRLRRRRHTRPGITTITTTRTTPTPTPTPTPTTPTPP